MAPRKASVVSDHDWFRQELVIPSFTGASWCAAELLNLSVFDREFGEQFVSTTERSALQTQLGDLQLTRRTA